MSLEELRIIASWHIEQAEICHQDFLRATAHSEHESGRRAFNLYTFHTDTARKLSGLADAFTAFVPQLKAS